MNDKDMDLHDLMQNVEPDMIYPISIMNDDEKFYLLFKKLSEYSSKYKDLREKIRDRLYDKRLDDGAKWDTWIECYKDLPSNGLWIKIDRPNYDFTQDTYELNCSYIKIEEFEKGMVYATEGSCWITVSLTSESKYGSTINREKFEDFIRNNYHTVKEFNEFFKTKWDKVVWLLQNCIMECIGCDDEKSVMINYDNNDFTVDLKFSVLSKEVGNLPKFITAYFNLEDYKYQIEHEHYTDFVIKGIQYDSVEYKTLVSFLENRDSNIYEFELDPKSLFFGKYNNYDPVNTEPCGADDKELISIVSSEFNEVFVD